MPVFLSSSSPREIYIRDVRGFDKLRDCRRVKDIRAKVFTSFSACFQIPFLPCILVPCIIRVEIANIKKKWSGKGGFLARIHAKKISNFTSEEYNLVYTSISIYTKFIVEKLEDRFDSPSLSHDCTFSRAEKLLRIGIYLALPTVCKNDYAKSCVNRRTLRFILRHNREGRDLRNASWESHLDTGTKPLIFSLERNCSKLCRDRNGRKQADNEAMGKARLAATTTIRRGWITNRSL